MRERVNNLDASVLMNGVSYGEHEMNPDTLVEDIERMCRGYANTFIVRCKPDKPLTDETYCALARLAKRTGMRFGLLYAYQFPPKGKRSHLSAALLEKIRGVCGSLFIGEFFGEAGSDKGAKDKGYYVEGSDVIALQMPPQHFADMAQAKDHYVKFIRSMTDYDQSIGLSDTYLVEATAFSKYNLEGGIRTPVLEVMPGNPENLVAFTRGAAIGYGSPAWGSFIANEWYGGYRHEDRLKQLRLEIAYKYLYLSGSNLFFLESGNNEIKSYGYDLGFDSPECTAYRETLAGFQRYLEAHPRPSCGPLARVAFLSGNLDPYTEFMGGHAWCQFRESWGKGDPERSWDILRDVYRSADWHDPANFGVNGEDFSSSPGYGAYDVIPVESPVSVLKAYDYLLFAGWNTMTPEILDKLKEYVECGGNLLITAAHLSRSARRDGPPEILSGAALGSFLGCEPGEIFRVNHGVKFTRDSAVPGVQYPGTRNLWCDANYPSGYANYVRVRLTTGVKRCVFSDRFQAPEEDADPVLVENVYGKGTVSFLTNADYPGNPAVFPVYRAVVKAILTASHAHCALKVTGSDKVRYSLFLDEKSGEEKLYLLNTGFAADASVTVDYRGTRKKLLLRPAELTTLSY